MSKSQIDFNKLSDRVTIEELTEMNVNDEQTFNLSDFPDEADLPAIDIQADQLDIQGEGACMTFLNPLKFLSLLISLKVLIWMKEILCLIL